MIKVGVLTINDYTNFGNRLQNYATQEVIKDLGFDVETIINNTMHLRTKKKYSYIQRIKNIIENESYSDIFRKMKLRTYSKINTAEIIKANKIKKEKFLSHTKKYIKESDFVISDENIPHDKLLSYDYFIVGSDQVWNPLFERFSHIDFLTFAPNHKRIAYAPSFGISKIPDEFSQRISEWLLGIKSLSIREDAGQKIINELTSRNAEILIDPTLMLTKEQWLSTAKESKHKPAHNYILTFFLGGYTSKMRKYIQKIAKQNDLEIVNLLDIYDLERYTIDPSEFIDYISSATLIFTDSFHGSVFSILFEKPFIVTDRLGTANSMNSRIDTLLKKFKLESRYLRNFNDSNYLFNIDFSHVPEILEFERGKTINYLYKSLNIKDEK